MSETSFELRPTERRQFLDIIPDVIELYESREQDDLATTFENMRSEINDDDSGTYTYDSDVISDVCYAMNEVESMRAAWLSSKIARRTDCTAGLQGFTTMVPIGTHMEARMAGR